MEYILFIILFGKNTLENIKQQTVYVLMLDHETQIMQHCLGVFTTFEKLIEAQNSVKLPTNLYETYFEYVDEPPTKDEFAIVETTIIENKTSITRATNMAGTYSGPRQMAFIDPDLDYIYEYINCVVENEQEMQDFFNGVPGTVYDQYLTPDEKDELYPHLEQPFDLGEENMNILRELLED
jgi:hypothetical protein